MARSSYISLLYYPIHICILHGMIRCTIQFITNVGLITSNGPAGIDIMAAEWTHHISYSPILISINVRAHDVTAENIQSSKEFGVNLEQ